MPQGMAWQGMAWHGKAWQGMARHGKAWQGMAGHGKGKAIGQQLGGLSHDLSQEPRRIRPRLAFL
jgi:hypothetical protein